MTGSAVWREVAGLADLAARQGWHLAAAAGDEIAWERGAHRVVLNLTAAGRLRRAQFGVLSASLEVDDDYPDDWPRYWTAVLDRRMAAERGWTLGELAQQWLTLPTRIRVGDEVLFEGQWLPVTAVGTVDVMVVITRRGHTTGSAVGWWEIGGHRQPAS